MDAKAVFLDIDNTLLDFDATSRAGMQSCFAAAGLPWEAAMYAVFLRENDKIWRKIEQGSLTRADLPQVRWQTILGCLGLSADGAAMEDRFRRFIETSAIPVQGAQQLLRHLHGKYILCAASNGPYQQQIDRLQKAGMLSLLDHCFVSERVGHEKPGREFFDACLAVLPGVLPRECVMLGDSLTADIAGGRAYGMQTIWFDYHHTGYEGPQPADVVVQSLEEVLPLL